MQGSDSQLRGVAAGSPPHLPFSRGGEEGIEPRRSNGQRPAVVAAAWLTLCAFVVEPGYRPNTDPAADLAAAPRWDAGARGFRDSGERGLGGGIEFAVDPALCDNLVFVDRVKPDCAAIRAVIAEAGRRWSVGHPTIRFTDVSDFVRVRLGAGAGGEGAEIDIVLAPSFAFARDHSMTLAESASGAVAADARAYHRPGSAPRSASGARLVTSGGAITSADIRFNSGACFYIDPAAEREECMHFPSVVLHELGHVLGLDHPDDYPERNLIAARDAALSTHCVPNVVAWRALTADVVMVGRFSGSDYWRRGLAPDDLAGRDALYPRC